MYTYREHDTTSVRHPSNALIRTYRRSASFHSLDSALSLLLTLLIASLSHPPTLAFAHILLQTAPPLHDPQSRSLARAIKEVSSDRRILKMGTMRCWAISSLQAESYTPSNSGSPNTSPPSSPRTPSCSPSSPRIEANGFPSSHKPGAGEGGSAALALSLMLHVSLESSDREILEVTKMAWAKVSSAIGGGMVGGGEVSVGVVRGLEEEA